jgi:hypothetical protein
VGFYVDEDETDRPRDVTIRMRRPGMRAIHPGKYIFRSDAERRTSMLTAAWNVPEMFQTGVVRAHVFPLRPVSDRRWDALLAVSFPVPLGETGGQAARREFGAVLAAGPQVVHNFSRQVTLEPDGPDVSSEPRITFLERLDIAPGRYKLTAVLSDPQDLDPHAARAEIDVPEVPRNELFLVGPVLGRAAGPNLVVFGSGADAGEDRLGEPGSFEPLLVQRLDEPVDLVALTQACFIGSRRREKKALKGAPSVERRLIGADGSVVGTLDRQAAALERQGDVQCQNLVDLLPVASLRDGEYAFEAHLEGAPGDVSGKVRFLVSR